MNYTSNTLAPADLLWFDTSTKTLKFYDGESWQSVLSNSSNSSSNNRVDLSNATSDYNLQVGQEAIINFSNATNIALHIATQSGSLYQMDMVLSNNAGTGGGGSNPIYLNPNNTSYSNAFTYREIFMDGNGLNSGSATYSSFRIGWAVASSRAYISNFTTNKHIREIASQTGISSSPTILVNTCFWNDTTTAWTSLGTITFPQSSSGYILIRRLV